MGNKWLVGIVAFSLALVSASAVLASPNKGRGGSGGWGMGGAYQRMYNPATVETLTGVVESVDKVTPLKGMQYGIHLVVKTDKETIPVHLGPGWFIERLDTKIVKGDTVEVKGSRVMVGGKPAVIAADITKGDDTLKLRDDNGVPVWAGWRKK